MSKFINDCLQKLHRDQGGAIVMLMLVTTLILLMMALTLYDSGHAARDKMDAQIAADASAFSHSVVKSRSMNMISYANTIKRMFFSYAVTWVNGFTALTLVTIYHTAQCVKWFPRIKSCIELVENALIIISEAIEAIPNLGTLGLIGGSGKQTQNELLKLERYQQYMSQITPWWAWGENVMRSMDNGAMVTASWPTPGSVITDVKSWAIGAATVIDTIFGSGLLNTLSVSQAIDALPLERRDRLESWSTAIGPFDLAVKEPAILSAADYCLEWTGSMEMILNTVQTATSQAKRYEYWRGMFLFLQVLGGSAGCALVGLAWYNNIQNAHFDWMINTKEIEEPNDWTNATSNITYSYQPRAGRHGAERDKYNYLSRDYTTSTIKPEGYFALARSEIVYKPALGTGNGLFNTLGTIPLLGSRLGLQPEPDMWSPRWTAKLRPVNLPGESLGAATAQDGTGLNTVVNDSIPYLLLAGTVGGIFDDRFTFESGWNDLKYLALGVQTFTNNATKGVSK